MKKNLSPFKWYCLENFPFLEAYIDAYDEYQLLGKLFEQVNKNNEKVNAMGVQVENLTDFVNTYFADLDVQEEINNKLNEMAEDGELQALIINYQLNNKKIIVIGDSYSKHEYEDITSFWWEQLGENLGLTLNTNLFVRASDGAGFYNDAFFNRLYELRNVISDTDKLSISDILIVGGWNDRNTNEQTLLEKMTTFNEYAKTTYPNARIDVAFVGNSNPIQRQTTENRVGNLNAFQLYNKISSKLGWNFLQNTNYILHNYSNTFWQDDGVHPSQLGQNELATYITEAIQTGKCDIIQNSSTTYNVAVPSGIATALSNANFISGISNENSYIKKADSGSIYINVDNAQLNCTGNNAYEIAQISDGFYAGNGTQSGTTIPVILSGTIGGSNNVRVPGYANIYMEYGKIFIKPLVYYNNQVVNAQIQYIFIPAFQIMSPSYFA